MKIIDDLRLRAKQKPVRVVFPEGDDLRVLRACRYLRDENLVFPVILKGVEAEDLLRKNGWSSEGLELVKDFNSEEYVDLLLEKRAHKSISRDSAFELLRDVNYQGVMMLESGFVDAMISGAAHPTASVIRPALQVIKTKPGINRVSSFFIMSNDKDLYFFSDCAFIINPSAEELKDIALNTANSAKNFNILPKVALLSFSSKGSAEHDSLSKIRDAVSLIKKEDSSLVVDGELQLDAAIVPSIAKLKCPGSVIQGDANVLVFPDLNSGNIGYKLVERLGNYDAIGPIMQGLNKPVNDLSRGCSVDDIIKVALITVSGVDK